MAPPRGALALLLAAAAAGESESKSNTRCSLSIEDFKPGLKVARGPQWKWSDQDGGAGQLGVVEERAGTCNGGQWWKVRWANGFKNVYRVGCGGNHDLQTADCAPPPKKRRNSCSYDDIYWPPGALPARAAEGSGCARALSVGIGGSCGFTKEDMVCDQPTCMKGGDWSTVRPVCHPAVTACRYNALTVPAGARTVAGIPGCAAGGLVPDGGHCSFSLPGHYCELAECKHGSWVKTTPSCSVVPTGHACPYAELKLPKGAAGSGCLGSEHAPSGTTCLPTLPSHTCEMSVCRTDGTWSREAPTCRRDGCATSQLQTQRGAETRGHLCGAGQTTPLGGICTVLLNGRNCGEALCESGGWAWTDSCPKPVPAAVLRAQPAPQQPGDLRSCALDPDEVKMGSTVRRGPNWDWREQDGHGEGVVTGFDVRCPGGGWWVQVRWRETGVENNYRVGCNGKTDLCRAGAEGARPAVSGGRGRGGGRAGAVLRGGGARGGFGSGRGVSTPTVSSALYADDMDREYDCVDATQLPGEPLSVLEAADGRRHCLRFCANAPLCGGVNFIPKNNTCKLLRSAGGATQPASGVQSCRRAITGGAAEAEVAFQCESGVDYKGANLFHFLEVATPADCQNYCAKVPECVASVHRARSCTLKGVLAERIVSQEGDEATTCSRLPAGEGEQPPAGGARVSKSKGVQVGYSCQQDVRFVGEVVHSAPSVPAMTLCRAICTRRGECDAFTFHADGSCVLLTLDSYAVPSNGATSCTKEGRAQDAAEQTPRLASSALVAGSKRRADVQVYTYTGPFPGKIVSEVREQCVTAGSLWVQAESGGNWNYQGSPAVTVTEPPLCWDFTCHLDKHYQGDQIMRVVNTTLEQCHQLCLDTPECCAFTHHAACPGLGGPNGNKAQCFTCDLMRAPSSPPVITDTVWRATTSCRSSTRCDASACVFLAFTVSNDTCPTKDDPPLYQERVDWISLVHEIIDGGLITNESIQSLDLALRECCGGACAPGGAPPGPCEQQYSQFPVPPLGFFVVPVPSCLVVTLPLRANPAAFAALWQFQSDVAAKIAAFDFSGSALAGQLQAVEVIATQQPDFQCVVSPPPATLPPAPPIVNFILNHTELTLCLNMPITVCDWQRFQEQFFADFQQYLNETLYPEVAGLNWTLHHPRFSAQGNSLVRSYGPLWDITNNVKIFPLQGKTEDCNGTTYVGRPDPQSEPVNPYLANAPSSVGFGHLFDPQFTHILPTNGRKGMVLDMAFDRNDDGGEFSRAVEETVQNVGMATLRSKLRDAAAKAVAAALRRARPRRYQCQSKRTYSGDVLGTPAVATDPDDCLARCTRGAGCTAAVFAADGTCTLHGPAATLVDAASGSSLMACAEQKGPRPQRPAAGFRCEHDKAYVGGDIFFIGRVNTSADCEHLCRTISAECDLYVWNGDQETCALKTSAEAAEVDDMPEHSGLACRQVPDERTEYKCAEAAYVGGDLFQVEDVGSSRACEVYCNSVARCTVAQYDAVSRRCALRTADAAPMPSSNGHEMACRKQGVPTQSEALPDEFHCDTDWGYGGGEIDRFRSADPDKCLQHCSQAQRCGIVEWHHGECVLRTSSAEQERRPGVIGCVRRRTEFRDAATAAATAAAADTYSCEGDVSHEGGDLMQVENAPDSGECKVHCAVTPSCALFTFAKGVCFLKTKDAVAVTAAGALSCRKEAAAALPKAPGGFKCQAGFGYYGGRLATLSGVDSAAACARSCGNLPECVAVSFTDKVCGLISSAGARTALAGSTACVREADAAALANVTSPGQLGPSSGFTCGPQRLLGGFLFDVAGVRSPAECAAHCRKISAECAAFTLSAAGVCSLRSAHASVIDAENSFAGTTCFAAAPASAPAAYLCQEGATLDGHPLRLISDSPSVDDCQWACSADTACRGFSFSGSSCSLKPAATKPRPVASDGPSSLACVRHSAPPPPPEGRRVAWHCSADTAYAGGELGIVSPITAPEDCQALCAAQPGCAISVLTPRGSCHLKSRAAAAVPRKAVVAVVRAQRQGELPPSGLACIREQADPRPWAESEAQETFRCVRQRALVGGELLSLPGLTLSECQAQCARVPQCAAAAVSGGVCSLRTAAAAQTAAPRADSVVCLRSFDSAAASSAFDGFDCAAGGGAVGGELLEIAGVASPAECAAHCAIAAGCELTVYHPFSKACSLRGHGVGATESADPTTVVCRRTDVTHQETVPAAPHAAVGWKCDTQAVGGGELFLLTGVASVRHCQLQCQQLSSCGGLIHHAGEATCLLKTAVTEPEAAPAAARATQDAVGCWKVENPAPRKDHLGRPVEACRCAANWQSAADGGRCGETQHGCPARPCDSTPHRWCRVANPGCATEGYGGWAYCDDSTPAHREGALVSDRRRGEALAITVPAPAAVMLNLVLTKTTVLVAGKLQAVLGLDFDNSGTVIRIYPDTTAAAAGLLIGDRFLEVAAVDIASVPAPEKAAKVLQAFETAPDGPVAVRVERWTSPEGLVWYFDFAHLLHLPHVTHEVFSGQASPDWTDHNSHDPGTFWVHSRVRSAGGGLLGPTVDNWHALNELIRNELSEIGGRFRENMNPVLSAMQLHPLEAGNIEVAAWSAPRFYRRAPVSKLDIKLIFHDTQCNAGTAQYTAVLAFLSGCLGVNPELLQVHNIERWAMERTHLPACYPSCRGNASLTRLFQCDRSLGEHLGCLNSRGDSIELRRMECREGGNEPEASELEPVDLVGGGSSARRADAQALGGNTDCRIELFVTLLLEQDVTAAEVQRRQHRNVTWTAAELALQSALSATSGPCDASALNLLHVETSYIDERIERRPICRTPAPEGGGWQNESGATPIPDEMPPADFTGWEDEGRAVMSAAIGRHLLQFQKKAAARRPVVQEGGVGKALYDPHRRLERIRRAEEEVLRGRGAARRAHTLQAATGTNPGVIQKEGCRKGVQSVQYGIMSNYWNLNNKQPLNCTLQECIDACLADEDCEGFSREALNTTADDEPSDCYLKRKVLPYCGDQYAWQDWGTYVVRCPPPETNPCTWTMVENAALHVVEEYKTHLQVESAQDCRDICERLDDCIGVSYKRWTGTCWFVHDKQGSHVDHKEYTSYICRRLVRTPSPYSGYAGTPAPKGWGDCRDHSGRCNRGEGTMCYNGLGTYRCGCAPGYLCDSTRSDCSDPSVTKKCVRRELHGHACIGDQHGCTSVPGGACYQLEHTAYMCGCIHGYHCVGAACSNTSAPLNCIADSCTDAMIGPDNWAVIQTIGGSTGNTLFDLLYAGWDSCIDCSLLPTGPLPPALVSSWTAEQQAAVAAARSNCNSGPTPAPAGSSSLAAAWIEAWAETLDDASRRQGQCWDMAGRVHIVCQSYKDANWSNASTAAGVPPEALDVSVNYVRVHTDRIHNLSVLLSGVPIDAVFGNGSSDGLSDGLSSTPLERLREEFAAAARVDLGKVAVRRICVERAITGEIIACFDAEGRPEGCFSPGLEFTSTQADVAQSTSINSAAACQDECQANAGCTLFAWNSQTQVCYMRTHTGAGTQSDPDYISGPVRCGVSWSASHCGVVKLSHFSAAAGNGTQCDGLYQPASAVNEWIPVDPIAGNNKDRVLVATTPVGTYACIHKDAVRPTSADSGVSLCPPGADCQNIDWWAANLVCQGATSATIDPLLDQQATICQHASNGTKDLWDKTRGNTGQTADREYLLECPVGRVLMIHDAFYGRSHCHGDLCFSDQDAAPGYRNCATDWCNTTGPLALRESAPGILGKVGGRTCRCEVNNTLLLDGVRGRCGTASQRTCLLKTSAGWLSVQLDENRPGLWLNSCPNENKYLWVKYSCISNVPSREAAVLQNEGPLDVSGVAALCAGGACNLRTDVSVDVPETDVMRVVQRGDGSVDTIAPSDVLPSDAHVVQQIGEPAPGGVGESVDDNVLGDMQTSENLPFVSQLLTALAEQNGQQLADATGINGAVFAGVCHVATSGPRIVCFQDFCQKADEEAMEIIRTACNGAPQCGPNFCNHHGTATGFWGACSCLCDVGYVGDRCDMCGVGRANYPACTAAAPAVAPAGTVPAGQSAGGATPQGPQIPSDSELEDMSFPGLVQLAQREGVWDDDLDTKQGVIRALKQRRDGAPPPPAPPVLGVGAAQSTPRGDLLWQTFHVVLAVPPADVTQQSVLEQQLLQLLQPYSAKAVSAQYVCRAAVCVPECPAGAVAQWDREQRESCAHLGQPISAGGGPDVDSPFVQAAGSSVLEFRVGYSAHGDDPAASLSAQSAMTVVALEGMVGRTDTPLGALGIQGAAQVDEAGAGGQQQQQQQQQGIQVSAALRESAVPVATLVAIGCVCFFVVFALYGRGPGGDMRDRRYSDWADGGDTCIIRKDRSEAMGVSWEDHTLVASVIDGSAAARAGLRNFIGRRVTHINGHPVQRLADIRQLSNGATELHLRFNSEDIPVCLHVNTAYDHFSEDRFVEELADAIDLPAHKIGVVNVTEEAANSLIVTVTFAGASPTFVRDLLDMCDGPHSKLARRLGISAASVAHDSSELNPVGVNTGQDFDDDDCDLYVSSQWADEPVAAGSGGYKKVEGFSMNGQPAWEKVTGGHWLYSTPNGHWCVTSSPKEFCDGLGIMRTQAPHGGANPEDAGPWETEAGVDADIVVSTRPIIVQGFRVGQRITSAEDITERSRIIVPIGQPGWVKGAASKIPDCGLKVRFDSLDRDVNVLPEEVDNARGPLVNVLSPGKVWRQCMIVNSNQTHLKVHYIGYDHDYDEWIEQGSDRIERVAASFPEGATVRLAPQAQSRQGVLADGSVGVIVRDAGPQHRTPYKVRGPQGDFTWYSGDDLVMADDAAAAVAAASATGER